MLVVTAVHILLYAFLYLLVSFLGWDINWMKDIGEWHPFYRFVICAVVVTIAVAFTFELLFEDKVPDFKPKTPKLDDDSNDN
tara:strand:- start:27 stop:272 length:246 start_codon:yes stop_codon:yes gene_type:complete